MAVDAGIATEASSVTVRAMPVVNEVETRVQRPSGVPMTRAARAYRPRNAATDSDALDSALRSKVPFPVLWGTADLLPRHPLSDSYVPVRTPRPL